MSSKTRPQTLNRIENPPHPPAVFTEAGKAFSENSSSGWPSGVLSSSGDDANDWSPIARATALADAFYFSRWPRVEMRILLRRIPTSPTPLGRRGRLAEERQASDSEGTTAGPERTWRDSARVRRGDTASRAG